MKKFFKMLVFIILLCSVIIPSSLHGSTIVACSCRQLEQGYLDEAVHLTGEGRRPVTEKERKSQIEIHKQRFFENFDIIVGALKSIFSKRKLDSRGPDWFYSPISDGQFSSLKKALPVLLTQLGSDFPDTKIFWDEYKDLRPASTSFLLVVDLKTL